MGLGVAMLQAFTMMALGYALWVIVVVAGFSRIYQGKRPFLGAIGLVSLILGPLVFFVLYVEAGIDADKERQRRDLIDLADARSRWKSICSESPRIFAPRRAVSSQREILVHDVFAERFPSYSGIPIEPVSRSLIFPESPFSTVLQRIPIKADDALCKDEKPGYQCRNPTHAYRFWSGQYEKRSAMANWDGDLRYVLTLEGMEATENRHIEKQTIVLTEADEVLARATVHYFEAAEDRSRLYCPDRAKLIRSMISEVFRAKDQSVADESLGRD